VDSARFAPRFSQFVAYGFQLKSEPRTVHSIANAVTNRQGVNMNTNTTRRISKTTVVAAVCAVAINVTLAVALVGLFGGSSSNEVDVSIATQLISTALA
jgi:hypothetical protein